MRWHREQNSKKGKEGKKNEIPSLIFERELAYVNETFPMFFTVNAVTVGTRTFFYPNQQSPKYTFTGFSKAFQNMTKSKFAKKWH